MQRMFGRALVVIVATFIVAGFGVASAQNTNSSNYVITEAKFGSGATLGDCSENYCAKASLGDNVVGSAESANFAARFGQITGDEPLLEVITQPGSTNLGDLTPERTATATRYIKVRSYLSDGYVIRVNGGSPTQGDKPLNALTTPTASQAGTEQFGINFVKNTQPDVGADLVHVPSNQFSFGEVLSGYDTPNVFKYIDGEAVARSTQSSGQTEYTMTMIVNVSNLTLAGQYQAAFSAVVIPLF